MASVFKKNESRFRIINRHWYAADNWKFIGIYQSICRYAKGNNKYMNNYNKDIISSDLMYLDANNLYGWAMSQTLPVNGF